MRTIPVTELPPDSHKAIAVGNQFITIFLYDGHFSAIGNDGLQQAGTKSDGMIEEHEGERYITYRQDGQIFNIRSGHAPERSEICQPVYKVKVEDGYIFVSDQPFKDGFVHSNDVDGGYPPSSA